MTTELFFVALLGLAIQGTVIYVAIRFALHHDRLALTRARAAEARTATKVQADAAFRERREAARLVGGDAAQR